MALKVLIYAIAVLALIMGYVKYLERTSIFFPMKEIEFTPLDYNMPFEDVYLETEDGFKLNAWFIPGKRTGYTVLFFHGNGGNMSHSLGKVELLHKLGLNVFIIDYRGYGKSKGRPSEKGLYLDAQAAYNFLLNGRSKPSQIILFGDSLGAAVAIDLGSREEIAGLVVEGAFSRGSDMAKKMYPYLPSGLFSVNFDSLVKVGKIRAPKLFIHSKNDEIVPFELGRKLYTAARSPKYFLETIGGHNTSFSDSEAKYSSYLSSFIGRLNKNR